MVWGLIIGLLVGGVLMLTLIMSESMLTDKKDKTILDNLDQILMQHTEFTVLYDLLNDLEKQQAYIFYACVISRIMWKGYTIVEATENWVKFNNGTIVRFADIAIGEFYFCSKHSVMKHVIPQESEYWEF